MAGRAGCSALKLAADTSVPEAALIAFLGFISHHQGIRLEIFLRDGFDLFCVTASNLGVVEFRAL